MPKRKTILIADDVELNRAILCELFQEKYNILEAENGARALALIEQHLEELSVILLDVVMPVMDGFEVLRNLRSRCWIERVPVILITAENNESTALEGYTIGVSDIINKPFNPEIVNRRVENIIELHEHKRYLEERLQEQYEKLEQQAQKLKQTHAFVIDTLSTVVEFRNCESGSHIRRIQKITRTLLEMLSSRYEEYRFSEDSISMITDAAALHDIGKIAIPDSVLLKPGRLTPEEYEIMKTHTTRGCEILESLNYAQDEEYFHYCYEICRHHHERWDGNGYPDHLRGNQISIWAQVVSLADVYEALTSERVYKPPYTHQQAVSMIMNGECGAFNPQLLKCFTTVADSLREDTGALTLLKPPVPHLVVLPKTPSPRAEASLSERTLWLLELEREKYRVLSELSGEVTFDYDAKSDVLQFSEKYVQVIGDNFQIPNARQALENTKLIPFKDKQHMLYCIDQMTPADNRCKLDIRIQTKKGELEWFELLVNSLWKGEQHPECVSLIGKLTNIHAAKLETERLRKRAESDPLTGLCNRSSVEALITSSLTVPDQTAAFFFLDIDDFKAINDDFGHQYGDQVLQWVSGALRNVFRENDVVGRIGGDEFVAYLCGTGRREILMKKAEEICGLFRDVSSRADCKRAISGSLGIALAPEDGGSYAALLSAADQALYSAKKSGKDRYAFFHQNMADTQFLSFLSDVEENPD